MRIQVVSCMLVLMLTSCAKEPTVTKFELTAAQKIERQKLLKDALDPNGNFDVDEFVEHIPFVETRNYVKKVVRNFHIYNLLYKKRKNSSFWLAKPLSVKPKSTDFSKEDWGKL